MRETTRQGELDKRRIDKKRVLSTTFKTGDKVAVLRVDRRSKLDPIYFGPCLVVGVRDRDCYQLEPLPAGVYDVFHVSRLKPWKEGVPSEQNTSTEPKWGVEAIVGHKGKGRTLKYLVHWKGWPKASRTYEPAQQLLEDGLQEEIAAYWDQLEDNIHHSKATD